MARAVSGALGRAMVKTFAGILGDLGKAAPGLLDAAAVQAAQALARNVPRAKRDDLGRRFIEVFAAELGLRVMFPIDVKVKVV